MFSEIHLHRKFTSVAYARTRQFARAGSAALVLSVTPASADSVIEARLTPSWYTGMQQYHGEAVDLHDDLLISGEPRTAHDPEGDVYIYQHESGGVWIERARLLPPADVRNVKRFGQSVALTEDYAFVGASSVTYSVNSRWNFRPVEKTSGAVFVYHRTATSQWQYVRRFVSSERYDGYASDIDASPIGDTYTLVVGAPLHEDSGTGRSTGAVHVHEPASSAVGFFFDGAVFDTQVLVPHDLPSLEWEDEDPDDHSLQFGHSIDIDGASLLIGAPGGYDRNNRRSQKGRAYLYRKQAMDWQFVQHLHTFGRNHDYGKSVALDGDRAVIGNPCIDSRGCGDAHVFDRTAHGDFRHSTELDPIGNAQVISGPLVHLGSAVALHENRILVGAESGQTLLFKHVKDSIWNPLESWVTAAHPIHESTTSALAIDDEHSAVGDRYHGASDTGRVTVRRHEAIELPLNGWDCPPGQLLSNPWCRGY